MTTLPSPSPTDLSSLRIAIAGAGPAGTALAILCARDGMDVTIFDNDDEPALGVGESLLPYGHRMWKKLGLSLDDNLVKPGAVFFRRGAEARISFSEAANCPYDTAFQVDRRVLDPRLRELARSAGAKFEHSHLRETPSGYDWVIDATGRKRVLGRHLTTYHHHSILRHIAHGSHFRGAKLPEGCQPGDIGIVGEDGMWFWLIPLSDDLMSVGVVLTEETRGMKFEEAISRSEVVMTAIKDAEMLHRPRGYADYTESAAAFAGPGWGLVGDAALFLDPIFSSGILFALEGADRMHQVIRGELDGAEYAKQIRKSAKMMEAVVLGFYLGDFLDLVFCPTAHQSQEVRSGLIGLLAGNLFQDVGRAEEMVARRLPGLASLTRQRMAPHPPMSAPIMQGVTANTAEGWLGCSDS
jgi:flavin-dependent dehydrogenase